MSTCDLTCDLTMFHPLQNVVIVLILRVTIAINSLIDSSGFHSMPCKITKKTCYYAQIFWRKAIEMKEISQQQCSFNVISLLAFCICSVS